MMKSTRIPKFMSRIWIKLWSQRTFRFLFVGTLCMIINILLIIIFIDLLHWNTYLWRSLANAISIEIGVLVSFFAYRYYVWQVDGFEWQQILRRELPIYHISIAFVLSIRIFGLFPLLDWLGIHHAINTMIGIALGAVLSYNLNQNVIFSSRATRR